MAIAQRPERSGGMDAARAAATVLVVLHHTAITYGAIGGWYYKEVLPGENWPSRLLVFFCTVNQAWFMGFFFLLAGYYTPAALAAKGGWGFLRGRWSRLGWPLLAYIVVIGPVTIALARTARGQPFIDSLLAVWRAGTVEMGPLWFAWALLLLALATVLARHLGVWTGASGGVPAVVATQPPAARRATVPAPATAPRAWPSDRALLWAALAVGASAFALRLQWPVGTQWAGLQLGYFASYLVLYAAGLWLAPMQGLAPWPAERVRRWRRIAWMALPVLPLVALLGPRWLGLGGRAEGGFSLLAFTYALWEPFVAWGVILSLLSVAQRCWAQPGPWGQALARRAFAIYVIHPPVVVAIALAWKGVAVPALLKFVVTGSLACVACFALAGALLRLPWLARRL